MKKYRVDFKYTEIQYDSEEIEAESAEEAREIFERGPEFDSYDDCEVTAVKPLPLYEDPNQLKFNLGSTKKHKPE